MTVRSAASSRFAESAAFFLASASFSSCWAIFSAASWDFSGASSRTLARLRSASAMSSALALSLLRAFRSRSWASISLSALSRSVFDKSLRALASSFSASAMSLDSSAMALRVSARPFSASITTWLLPRNPPPQAANSLDPARTGLSSSFAALTNAEVAVASAAASLSTARASSGDAACSWPLRAAWLSDGGSTISGRPERLTATPPWGRMPPWS